MSNNQRAIQKSLELLKSIVSFKEDEQKQIFESNILYDDTDIRDGVEELLSGISNREITVREFQEELKVILYQSLSREDLLMESK